MSLLLILVLPPTAVACAADAHGARGACAGAVVVSGAADAGSS